MLDAELTSAFFYYLHEREKVRIAKEHSLAPKPWTHDPILQEYKFTNVLREHDRTTRWMREYWTGPNLDKAPEIQLLNCGIFRYFGTIEFANELGYQQTWDPESIKGMAKRMMDDGRKVFTGAYIITNNGRVGRKFDVVVDDFLTPFWAACPEIARLARDTGTWEAPTKRLMKVYGFGGFMAKEIMSDAQYTSIFGHITDRNSWSPVGPGAIRGLNRLHNRPIEKSIPEIQALDEMIELFDMAKVMFEDFMPKVGIDYDLHCVQFGLCEIDKYLRVKNNEGRPRSKYAGKI